MKASSLRNCLNSVGGSGINPIEVISTQPFGHEDYLDNVCDSVYETWIYNKARTESQQNTCSNAKYAYIYPGCCKEDTPWLECESEERECDDVGYDGFFCSGMCKGDIYFR